MSSVLMMMGMLPLLILCGVLMVLLWRRQQQDGRGMRELVERLQAREAGRKTALKAYLTEGLGLAEPALTERVELIDAQRKLFYKALIQAFLKQDRAALAQLDEPLDAYIDVYHLLARPEARVETTAQDDALHGEAMRTLNLLVQEHCQLLGVAAPDTILALDDLHELIAQCAAARRSEPPQPSPQQAPIAAPPAETEPVPSAAEPSGDDELMMPADDGLILPEDERALMPSEPTPPSGAEHGGGVESELTALLHEDDRAAPPDKPADDVDELTLLFQKADQDASRGGKA